MDRNDFSSLLNQMEASNRNSGVASVESGSGGSRWKVFIAGIHSLMQTLIGGNVCVTLWFALSSPTLSAFHLHVVFSVIGYQLLLAHGILSLQSTSWSFLSVPLRRRVHLVLQIFGSIFAVAGSAVMIKEKGGQFKSWHSKLALLALILTSVSLINGLTSLYSVELRRLIPAKLSKISHITLGSTAFALSSVSLAFAYNKKIFKKWASSEVSTVMICVLIGYTIVVVAPTLLKILNAIRVAKAKSKKY